MGTLLEVGTAIVDRIAPSAAIEMNARMLDWQVRGVDDRFRADHDVHLYMQPSSELIFLLVKIVGLRASHPRLFR